MGAVEATVCYRELGADLRRVRESFGLSGMDIMRRSGRNRTRIARIESGRTRLTAPDVIEYAMFCGLTYHQARAYAARQTLAEHSAADYWMSPRADGSRSRCAR